MPTLGVASSAAESSSPERKKQKASATTSVPSGKKPAQSASSSPKRKGVSTRSGGSAVSFEPIPGGAPKAKKTAPHQLISEKIVATARVFGGAIIPTSSSARAKAARGASGAGPNAITPAKASSGIAKPPAAEATAKVAGAPGKSAEGKWEIPAVGTISAEYFNNLQLDHQKAIAAEFNCESPDHFLETVLVPTNQILDNDVANERAGLVTSSAIELLDDDDDDDSPPPEGEMKLWKPTGKTSPWWKHYMEYNTNAHPEKKGLARCKIKGCGQDIKCDHGTGGLKKHMQYKHPEEFEAVLQQLDARSRAASSLTSGFGRITRHFTKKKKDKTVAELQAEVRQAIASWMVDAGSVPLSAVERPSFRQIFHPLHDKASEIVKIGSTKCREEITKLGMLAKDATCRELLQRVLVATLDHWTDHNDQTWSCITGHYIEDWFLRSLVVDFKVWKGRTTGDLMGQDMGQVLKKYCMLSTFLHSVTDTTGNMVTLGRYLRSKHETEHAFCVDHNLHRNAIQAFDNANCPGADNAMSCLRELIAVFTGSTQAMEKLLNFQRSSDMAQYSNLARPLKVIQDVPTRWWSTFRMCRRVRFLRPAITALVASGQVSATNLEPFQWTVIHQIEMALEPLASAQRILEGENYVTGSLVPYVIHSLRAQYLSVMDNPETDTSVISLTHTLLQDFEARYEFESGGKVKYPSTNTITGHMNRYVTVHQYNFIAALLDPRMKGNLKKIMVPEAYEQLLEDVKDVMVQQATKMAEEEAAASIGGEESGGDDDDVAGGNLKSPPELLKEKPACIFDNFDDGFASPDDDASAAGAATIRDKMDIELTQFLHPSNQQPIKTADGDFNNPLLWWRVHEARFPVIAKLASVFLAIPATSAPTERVWSRASQVMSIRRARMSEDIATHIMFARENLRLVYKYYEAITGNPASTAYLPPLEGDYEVDAGQDDHLLLF